MNNELVLSDAMRLGDAILRIRLWTRQRNGENIFKNAVYNPQERISYYEARRDRYAGYIVKHVRKGFGLNDIFDVIEDIYKWLPDEIKEFLLDTIKNLIKNLLKGVIKNDDTGMA